MNDTVLKDSFANPPEIAIILNMENKRIELITTEMFIAWGIISMTSIILDAHILHLGFSPLTTLHVTWSDYPRYIPLLFLVLLFSSMPGLFLSMLLAGALKTMGCSLWVAYSAMYACQIAFYWYLGNLFGRFLVWCKLHRQSKKTKTVPKTMPVRRRDC